MLSSLLWLPSFSAEAQTDIRKDNVYVGIDLGTTFTCVRLFKEETKTFDYLTYGMDMQNTIPSTVYINSIDDGENLGYSIGYEANAQLEVNYDFLRYFYGYKRMMGISDIQSDDPLQKFREEVSYKCVKTKDNSGKAFWYFPCKIGDSKEVKLTPTLLSSLYLKKLRSMLVDRYEVKQVVVTTPAHFSETQNKETFQAAVNAGFASEIVHISKEPVAACAAYLRLAKLPTNGEEQTVMVFDFGGGTLDISIVEISKDVDASSPLGTENIVVLTLDGDNFLGGENVNEELVKHFYKRVETIKKYDAQSNDMLRLREFANAFKLAICNKQLAIDAEAEKNGNKNPEYNATHTSKFNVTESNSIEFTLTIEEFDRIIEPIYKRIMGKFFDPITGMFREKEGSYLRKPVDKSIISNVILVGGSTRIPKIRRMLKNDVCPNANLKYDLDADKAVADGACYFALSYSDNKDVAQPGLNVMSVVPLPIGIEVKGGMFHEVLHKDSRIPIKVSANFTTVFDGQRNVTVRVASGMRPKFKDNEYIGQFDMEIENAEQRKAGEPEIVITIDYNEDYKFKVTAKDNKTNKEVSTVFNDSYGREDKHKVDEIIKNSKAFSAVDEEIRNKSTKLNELNMEVSKIEMSIKAVKLSEDDQMYFDTIVQGFKEFTSQNIDDMTLPVIDAKIESAKKSYEELMQRMGAGKTAEQPPADQWVPPHEQEATQKEKGREL